MKNFKYRKYCLIIILLALVSINIQAQNGWTKKANLPTPRTGASTSVFNNKIYVIGGYNLSGDLKVNEVYDPLTDTWEIKQPMPTKRGYLLSVLVNDTIYAMGGGDVIHTNKNEAYDPITNSWTTKANLPYTWNGVYGDTVDGIVYIMGGHYSRQNCFAYNPKTNTWLEKSPIPIGGCKGTLSATAYNGLIYTFGGVTNYPDGPMSAVNVYDPKTDTWESKASMPTPRFALRTFLVEGKIYAIGGSQSSGNSLSSVEVYDPINDSWEILPDMPFKVSWFTGAVFNNKIYVFGGTPDWSTARQEVWEYVPLTLYTQQSFIDKPYAKINTDSVLFRTGFSNPKNINFTSNLIYSNSEGIRVDSLGLYDDGVHGDSLLNDGFYAAYIPPLSNEDFYTLSISITENQTQNYLIQYLYNDCKFTTAGPIKLDSIRFVKGITNYYNLRPFVRNEGTSLTISNAKIQLKCNDPWVTSIAGAISLPSIAAGTSGGASSWIAVTFVESIFPGYFNLKAEMSVDGWIYWTDSIRINVITGLEEEASLPSAFKLEQNYPNPFNPSTKISWQIPASLNPSKGGTLVTLKVYDILGNEVKTLVNKEMESGYHSIDFNASDLPSGVYFYRIHAGSFISTRKMLLLK